MMVRITRGTFVLLSAVACACTSYVKPLPAPAAAEQPVKILNLSDRSPAMTILSSLTYAIPLGTNLGQFSSGWNGRCSDPRPMTYRSGDGKSSTAMFEPVFKDVMGLAGIPVQQGVQRFEGEEIKKADLQIAAIITDETINVCFPDLNEDKDHATGEAYVKIEWSVFSPLERTVVYSVTTTGKTTGTVETRLGGTGVVREAFRDALGHLVVLPAFTDLVVRKKTAEAKPGEALTISQPPESTLGIDTMLDALRKGIVTIRSNDGEGSGFAIGDGTYIVTAAHVVSGSTQVKLLGSGESTYYADVVKVNPARDLALLKVRTVKLQGLHLSSGLAREGREVYAVGSPLGEKYAFSVTKGVIGGIRRFNERDYIQSDVKVLPGSSGGPLMDASGNVIGVTVSGMEINGAPMGMNFFVPAVDIAPALALKLKD